MEMVTLPTVISNFGVTQFWHRTFLPNSFGYLSFRLPSEAETPCFCVSLGHKSFETQDNVAPFGYLTFLLGRPIEIVKL